MPTTVKIKNNLPETTFVGVGVNFAVTGQLNKTLTITVDPTAVTIAAGTDGLAEGSMQETFQALATRIQTLEDA